ncbi:MAG: tRNA 2-thiouridine(34) synthase MnmA [Mogibacterium sp.]|nr:tRNA 2-thiouridine(34) synthase MnmA [Mogibacterium sp.]
MTTKTLIAMSGGVDSSVAAWLVRASGDETAGAVMRLYDPERSSEPDQTKCGSSAGIEDARAAAGQLGIPFYVCDFREVFREEVIGYFVRSYELGQTPNPCVECNRRMKFGRLLQFADELGYDRIATGHYAVIEHDAAAGRYLLRKAIDPAKDQSYVLSALTQEQLSRTVFPLGGYTKPEIRAIAAELGLITASKKESQDICFVPDGDYVKFIQEYTGRQYPPGDFVDREGHVLGRHRGIIRYTIGQRKGLGLALKKPQYVTALDIPGNRVLLGDNEQLFTRDFEADRFNWIATAPPAGDLRACARIRYKHREAPATVHPLSETRVHITFDEPQRAITPGQTVVLYDGDLVVGGGTIV